MNHTYRSVWNESLGTWVAASEISSARGKLNKSGLTKAVTEAVLSMRVTVSATHVQYSAGGGVTSAVDAIAIGGSPATVTGESPTASGRVRSRSVEQRWWRTGSRSRFDRDWGGAVISRVDSNFEYRNRACRNAGRRQLHVDWSSG
ncbi:ESPR domain-containing protein [Burkholderia pyrrocinia]|uniref:ESPR domain-containing protein n=1 Tax=Burkholderia pyrrocinia TaxID=60550 RepID=UPI00158BE4E9